MKIIIDAGHRNNTNDYGATGNGLRESALALSIALKLKKQLEAHNITCYTTRDSEHDVISLNERCRKANYLGVDLFVSIHINSAERKEAAGVETLYFDNKSLADKVCTKIVSYTGAPNRGAKIRTDLCVLNSTRMPAILVECGFISNPTEAQLLAMDNYQTKIATAIAEAIVKQYKILIPTKVDNQKAYLENLLKTGTDGQKAWAKQQLLRG